MLEILLILFLSKVVTNYLARFFYNLTKSYPATVNFLAIIFLPGTILHELAHLLTAGVMLVPVGELEVIPVISEGGGVQLGSVQIGQTDPIRRMLIGFAPIFFGVAVILGIIFLSLPALETNLVWWQLTLTIYGIFVVGNTMFSSKKDLEGVLVFVITIVVVGLLLLILNHFLKIEIWQIIVKGFSWLDLSGLPAFFKLADTYLLAPIAIDLVLVLTLKASQKG